MKALEFSILRMIALMELEYSFCEAFEKEGFSADVAVLKSFAQQEMVGGKAKAALKKIYKDHIENGDEDDIKKYNEVTPIKVYKIKTADDIIEKVDFAQLKEQKLLLLELMPEGNSPLDGLLNLIDTIQDYAVDILGKDEKEVFNLDSEDEEE